jgi:hypothetical protein
MSINRLLRQYFPKCTDLSRHSIDELAAVTAALNSPARHSAGEHQPKPSTITYYRFNRAVLRLSNDQGVHDQGQRPVPCDE